jgi:carbon storage regulator
VVTDSRLHGGKVLKVFNGRRNVGNSIKEGKNSLRWDKASCQRFEAKQARDDKMPGKWRRGRISLALEMTMLIVTLKKDERVRVGMEVAIMVVEIRGKQVRLGIEAPPGVLVLREKIKKPKNDDPS